MGNMNLHSAKKVKNDEFYTQLSDIENEMKYYKEQFKGKTVYCNCDDPQVSNFFNYFTLNFEHLGLKKLIASCYRNTDSTQYSKGLADKAVWLEYTGEHDGGLVPTTANITVHEFEGDGDFRSAESIALLKEADIVVTNPPFSLFRAYIDQLMAYDKQFLVLGNMNAVTYKEMWPLIQDNMMWLGVTRVGTGQMWFMVSDDAPVKTGQRTDENGVRYQTVGNSAWFTNLDNYRRNDELILWRKYADNPELYQKYDNYDAINVNKVVDIPIDYDGVMGVPITFLGKHNPDQFEFVGGMTSTKVDHYNFGYPYVDGKKKYARLLIRNKKVVK